MKIKCPNCKSIIELKKIYFDEEQFQCDECQVVLQLRKKTVGEIIVTKADAMVDELLEGTGIERPDRKY